MYTEANLSSTWANSPQLGCHLPWEVHFAICTHLETTVDATKVTAFSRIEMLGSCSGQLQHHRILAVRSMLTQNTSGTQFQRDVFWKASPLRWFSGEDRWFARPRQDALRCAVQLILWTHTWNMSWITSSLSTDQECSLIWIPQVLWSTAFQTRIHSWLQRQNMSKHNMRKCSQICQMLISFHHLGFQWFANSGRFALPIS